MPLSPEALNLIRTQLEKIARGDRPRLVTVGKFTVEQLVEINDHRLKNGFPLLIDEIVFDGRHLYRSRCTEDGYSIEDVVLQLISAFSGTSRIRNGRSTVLANPIPRKDREGRPIQDEAVFECTSRHPRAELYSVVPRGDGKNHTKNTKATVSGGFRKT